ncbi:MAG: EAL domain-containing protein [Pseudomonadales bacterium]
MSHSLGLTVVAEGVETEQQLDYLRSLNCDAIHLQLDYLLPAVEVPTAMCLVGKQQIGSM